VGVPVKCYRWRDADNTDIFYSLTISFIQVHIHFIHIQDDAFVARELAPAGPRSGPKILRSLRNRAGASSLATGG
jgi:hypothetical protein